MSHRHWSYRIVRSTVPTNLNPPQTGNWYAIHEAHFDDNGDCYAISEEPATIGGETISEVTEVRAMMFSAIKSPILDLDELTARWAKQSSAKKRTAGQQRGAA